LPQLREAIRSTKADIVFLQEVSGENLIKERKHSVPPWVSHYEFLAEKYWPFYTYGKNAVYPHGHHGNAILSRYPVSDSSNMNISTNKLEQRGLLYCCVRAPGLSRMMHCMSVHLNLLRGGRRKQLKMLEIFIRDTIPNDSPLVLAGDFNDWGDRDVLPFASKIGLTDAVRIPFRKKVRTFPEKFPLMPLDHILVRGVHVVRSIRYRGGFWKKLSDHSALGATIDIV
jgi:endonuclease/exonuclease/phosphatase family metal-dependent hydrolase